MNKEDQREIRRRKRVLEHAKETGCVIRTIDRAIQLRPRQWCFNLLRAICCRSAGDDTAASQSDAKLHVLIQEPSILALRPPLPEAYREFADQFAPP